MKFSTKAIHVGQGADLATGATIVPIYQTSTYTQEEIGKHKGFEYSRTGNPTRQALEECLASLESGKYGMAFASGLAATNAVLSILRPGDHIISGEDVYGGTYRLFEKVFAHYGITATYVDGVNPEEIEKAIRKETRMIWLETPTNPLLQLTDIAAVAKIAKKRNLLLAVDNTFATPYLQRPLELGADIIVHSTTKYIGGHSDVVGGAVVLNDRPLYDKIKFYQNAAGAIPGPFDSWLVLRGLKTLSIRMKQHEVNALAVANYLKIHPRVVKVNYPGLKEHPQYELARKQMSGFSGMISFELKGSFTDVNLFMKSLRIFSLAESLGGVESLACHPASMTHASIPKEERERRGIKETLIRLSVGIEDEEDLIADLSNALEI
ncbi:MAG TPA: cystathionine gamma-synthase [Lentisphaeria bacterium]|nr:MAG: cystathionine gamma-synthase [Lentisphaerae bacterium GWF2_38_69]HBM17306.1 cystathionine gamma-synthase [Lentisphaeria bacterium]